VANVLVLGELELEANGRVLARIESRRARSLLGWLAVHPGLHPRERVAAVFWPDVLDASARTSLRTTLATLKRELGEAGASVVTATRDRVGIAVGSEVWIDLDAFQKLVAGGDLEQAAALCRGELLADLDDEWMHEVRERHRRHLVGVLGRLADHAERSGDLRTALERTREQVALDPLSDQAQRHLLRCLAATGERAAALAAYQSYGERLRRELGIAPSAETRELVRQIREGGAAGRMGGAGDGARAAVPVATEAQPIAMRTRYAKSGDANVAYQVTGEGPRDLVIVPGFASHIEHCWTHPPYARFMRRLGATARVIVFDKRGSGLSDPLVGAPSLEERTDDVRAVMDAVGLEHATVMGISDGAGIATLFAAMNPGRVDGLILYAGFEVAVSSPDYPWAVDTLDDLLDAIDQGWGEGVSLGPLASAAADDEPLKRWWAGFERLAASPGQARAALELYAQIDLREVLPAVQAPTLVIHRTHDVLPIEGARRLAAGVRGARFVELPGDDHWPWIHDADDLLPELEEFLTGERHAPEPDRVLATVLFTDIVGSTERASALGDRRWRELLAVHERLVRRELGSHRGRALRLTGDGVLASFDTPARGIRCACAIRDGVRDAGLEIRAGLHTGECELLVDDLGGMAIHIGARVVGIAAPGEVLVSNTVKDLVAGSPIVFDDRGAHVLSGIPGEWRLYEVAAAS
jgi:DNA-binding SARP family transcriptional activator/pimeloyl-ACP methyl ester carboxylesterase